MRLTNGDLLRRAQEHYNRRDTMRAQDLMKCARAGCQTVLSRQVFACEPCLSMLSAATRARAVRGYDSDDFYAMNAAHNEWRYASAVDGEEQP